MNVDLAQELFNELSASLRDLETQHAALLQFLKDKGILRDDQITPYLEQAGKASSVRWRAAHIRMDSLLQAERQKEEELREKGSHQAGAGGVPPSQNQPQAETKNEAGTAKAAPRNEEDKTGGAVEGNGKQPVADKDDAQEEHASSKDKKPGPSPQETKQ